MASRCSTALVEPPVPATPAMALSNAVRVQMSRGRMFVAHRVHDHFAAAERHVVLARVHLRDRGGAHRREADQFHHGGHGVGGELAAAGARAGAGVVFDIEQFGVARSCRARCAPTASKTS